MNGVRSALALLLIIALSACGRIIPPSNQPPPPQIPADRPAPPTPAPPPVARGENAIGAGIATGPGVRGLLPDAASVSRALTAFRQSCPSLVRRADPSGITAPAEWASVCETASRTSPDGAADFFASNFSAVQIGDGSAFATGYYEPEIEASRGRRPGYEWPIYGMPGDLPAAPCTVDCDRGGADSPERFTRAGIERGSLAGRGLEIAYARDRVDLYFVQVQGSGLLRLPDGAAIRIGYAGNNGYPYVSIGAIMRDRAQLEPGQLTAEGIAVWLRQNPEQGRGIMQENRRYIFFRELNTSAPVGSLGYAVTPRTTVAADPNYVPLGAPVILDMEHDIADGLWVAQDTGGAITGANRFDTFWGAGAPAYAIASGMASRGVAWILIPRAAAARLARAD